MTPAGTSTDAMTAQIRALNDQYLLNTYGARKIALARGHGATLWDVDGKEYLDFFAGIAVCNLGHAHPAVTQAIREQAEKLLHVSNLFYIEGQADLAQMLSENSFADRWFFCNSGAEANEAAIKLARSYWAKQGAPKPEIVTAVNSFHGRTIAALTATGQPKYHAGFEPVLQGFRYVPYNDIDALAKSITPETGAVLLEPIQGEGGVRMPADGYLQAVRSLCDERDVLLILDEVQTGIGRTGKLFAHEHAGIAPDIISVAKALGNGVPIGGIGCVEKVAAGFVPGSHASTFGGNPLSCAAALATVRSILQAGFLDQVEHVSEELFKQLHAIANEGHGIVEVRGKGLMVGVEFDRPVAPLLECMIAAGVLCGPAGPNVLRFLPPLIITRQDVEKAIAVLKTCLGELGW